MIRLILKIVTYNIHHGVDIYNNLNLKGVLQVLQQTEADIIALQEVDRYRPQTHLQNQAAWLAKKLSMGYVYSPVRNYKTGSYGNAILSKYSILSSSNHRLHDMTDIRYCLRADIDTNGSTLSIFNTHLGLKQPVRYTNLKNIILPLILPLRNPGILAGDFNAPDDRPEVHMVSALLTDTFKSNSSPFVYTYPAANPSARIDYIFINQKCIPLNFYIVDSTASDHLPVVAEISYL
ncbi:MAG: endonuclease/exonuclease/phosphatase family protein [Syntrophomonadaceae bacterium]|nr:endonuclease/exonuclease/phosphatase family protein [Syntrophomonadaceae bacterium]